MSKKRKLYLVSGMGRDVSGLVSLVTSIISDVNGNIIDLEETVLHGLFSIFLTVDLTGASVSGGEFISKMQAVAHQSGLSIAAEEHRLSRRGREREITRLTVIGPDHSGIISAVTFVLANGGINVERAQMVARGDLFAMEMDLDRGAAQASSDDIEQAVTAEMERFGMRCFFQRANIYRKKVRLIVFTRESNMLEEGVRKELLDMSGGAGEKPEQSPDALADLGTRVVERIAATLRLDPEGEELLHALKMMGFQIGLILPGYDRFLSSLKLHSCIDYIYADRLLAERGMLTGELKSVVGDAEKKRGLISTMAKAEGVGEKDTIVVGDGEPAEMSLSRLGFSVTLDKDHIAGLLADATLEKNQIPALIRAFGPGKGVKS